MRRRRERRVASVYIFPIGAIRNGQYDDEKLHPERRRDRISYLSRYSPGSAGELGIV